jgi:hypothetical protein
MSTQSVFQRIHSLSCLKWWQIKKRRALKASITIELIGLLQAIELNTRQNYKCNYLMMPESFKRKVDNFDIKTQ